MTSPYVSKREGRRYGKRILDSFRADSRRESFRVAASINEANRLRGKPPAPERRDCLSCNSLSERARHAKECAADMRDNARRCVAAAALLSGDADRAAAAKRSAADPLWRAVLRSEKKLRRYGRRCALRAQRKGGAR